jgi:hypothetical protein
MWHHVCDAAGWLGTHGARWLGGGGVEVQKSILRDATTELDHVSYVAGWGGVGWSRGAEEHPA